MQKESCKSTELKRWIIVIIIIIIIITVNYCSVYCASFRLFTSITTTYPSREFETDKTRAFC